MTKSGNLVKNLFLETSAPFLIYNASAGSGKTFTLVKEYLKKVFDSGNDGYYKHLLAITFTNKAVAEMKQRLVETLISFSEDNSIVSPTPIMAAIAEETGLNFDEIQTRSKAILRNLLHNYGAFSVETIDHFNHRLIRTFARDLKLGQNFEVTLDTQQLLQEAVDSLLSKTGENEKVTNVLLDFALQKTDDDKSYDIARDIVQASKLIYDETNAAHVSLLKEKSLDDFSEFKRTLFQKRKNIEGEIEAIANQTLQLIKESGLEHSSFMRSTLPNHFLKLQSGNYNVYGNKLQENLETGKSLYKAKEDTSIISIIEGIVPDLLSNYLKIKERVGEFSLYDNILNNITPLSVISLVNQEIENIKNDKNILPISEFNSLINTEIKNQPAPFIYERLGEKYRHFFIDEFQDTSKLQWENLIPLIDNALAQKENNIPGSLLLVGDAKQSIYRWRGGLPEQFMALYDKENPFPSQTKNVMALDTNYRSREEIIDFNNQFFTFISQYFASENHQDLYVSGNKQHRNHKKEGYVNLEFIEKQSKSLNLEVYSERVHQTILEVLDKNYAPNDICILTRKKADGIYLGSYLMEQGIPVISSETLLLKSSAKVQILILSLTLALHPNNEEAKVQLLDLLHDHWAILEEKHDFFYKFIGKSEGQFQKTLSEYGIDFNLKHFRSLSIYEAFEYGVRQFNLSETADAYLFGFMDFVFEFGAQPMADKGLFLDYWETKKDSASIPASEGVDAVQLMTIHKSKGLEFPVVIFPFADIQLYDAKWDTLWYPLENEAFNFTEALINYKSEIANYGAIGEFLYHEHRSELELDNINMLYVTLTRAAEKLYVLAEMPSEPKDGIPLNYNHLFMEFLKSKALWNAEQYIYEFGENTEKVVKEERSVSQTTPSYISSDPKDHKLFLVPTDSKIQEFELASAILEGNLLHETMAKIKVQEDASKILAHLKERSILREEDFNTLKRNVQKIINHPELEVLFNGLDTVYCERDIITSGGEVLRPDRINIHPDGSATIIDYKTGSPQSWHNEQLGGYSDSLSEMGYSVSQTILIYMGDELRLTRHETTSN